MVPTRPAAEVTLMIRPVPSPARNGSAAWLTVKVPPTWTSSTSRNCSAVIFANIAGAITPALFTTTCKVPPVSSAACSATRAACAGDLVGDRGRRVLVHVSHEDGGTGRGQRLGDRGADAVAGASYQRGAP